MYNTTTISTKYDINIFWKVRNSMSFSMTVATISGHVTLHCIKPFIFRLVSKKMMRKGRKPVVILRTFKTA
jgi:hypothetical protein